MSLNYTPLLETEKSKEKYEASKITPVDQIIKKLLGYFETYPQLKNSQNVTLQNLMDTQQLIDQWHKNEVPTTQGDGNDTADFGRIKTYVNTLENLLLNAIEAPQKRQTKNQ